MFEAQARRKRPQARADELGRVPQWLTATAWAIALVSMLCYGMAKPEQANMFDRFMDVRRIAAWDQELLKTALGLNLASILIGLIPFLLNFGSPARSKDQWGPGSLLVLACLGLYFLVPRLAR